MANNLYSSSSSFRVERWINFVRQSQLSETHWKLAKRNYDAHVCNITYKKYYRFNVCIQLMTTHCISVFRPARWDCVGRNFHLFCTVPGLSLQCTLGKSEYLSCCTCYTLNILWLRRIHHSPCSLPVVLRDGTWPSHHMTVSDALSQIMLVKQLCPDGPDVRFNLRQLFWISTGVDVSGQLCRNEFKNVRSLFQTSNVDTIIVRPSFTHSAHCTVICEDNIYRCR